MDILRLRGRYKHFRQIDSGDCAASCLRSVAHHHGNIISRAEAEHLVRKGPNGASLLDLREAFDACGAKTSAKWCSLGHIIRMNSFPCIAHIRGNHFVVIIRATYSSVAISDPEQTSTTVISATRFLADFASLEDGIGAILFIESFPAGRKGSPVKTTLRTIAAMAIKAQAPQVLGVGVLALIAIFVTSAVPLLMKNFLDKAINASGVGILALGAITLLAAQLCLIAMNAVRIATTALIRRRLLSVFSEPFLTALVKLDYTFFLTRTSGDVLQRLNDQARLENFASKILADALTIVAGLLGGLIGLSFISPIGAAATATCAVVVSVVSVMLLQRRIVPEADFFDASAKARGSENEIARSILSIKAAAHERQAISNWKKFAKQKADTQYKLTLVDTIQASTSEILVQCCAIIVLLLVTWPALGFRLASAGDIGAFSIVLGTIFAPLIRLATISRDLQEAHLASERTLSVSQQLETEQRTLISSIDLSSRAIHFSDVSFAYPGSKELALKSVAFTIQPNSTCAIMGASGSGKTTVGLLIARLLLPGEGKILLGDTSIADIDPDVLRSKIGFVLQEGAIYEGSIAFNIAGHDDANPETIWHLLRICCLDSKVANLRAGLSTQLGSGFEGLSGGQKQRLLLARALYNKPSIIVLDEATSALDLDTEACVLRNLSQEFPNTTTIIIAHRESTIRLADQVIHMKKGRVEGRVSQNDCDPISKHPSDQEKYLFERPTQIDQST